MSILLTQVGRTTTSVTFQINGITGDRQTLVYIPEKDEYVKLDNAKAQGYVGDYTTTDAMNGRVTLNFSKGIAAEFPVWQIQVHNCVEGVSTDASWAVLCTKYNFDNVDYGAEKTAGNPFDLTAADMNRFNLFAKQLEVAYTGNAGTYYTVSPGDSVLYKHVRAVAKGIYEAANWGVGIWTDEERVSEIRSQLNAIKDAGNMSFMAIKEETLNALRNAINDLNFSAAGIMV